mmetsp:Transcript_47895/g.97894  ORF Transcript_47895/g.97894 Transcript_47895/m.97894 type:complete len:225 (-) Transcript_47895:190-864(-)
MCLFFLFFLCISIPAAFSSLRFCKIARRRASSSCFSLALRFAFFPRVLANLARASESISFSSSSMSTGSGLAGLHSGLGSISPGLRRRGSSPSSGACPSLRIASSNSFSYRSRHCAAVRPTMGAMVRHCVGMIFARCSSFSSSTLVHSVFLMLGSSHSYQRALHCFEDLRESKLAIRDHWFFPYFMTAAFRISSSVFFHTPPLIMIRIVARFDCELRSQAEKKF